MLKELRAAPNLLTFLRLCLIPFLVIAVLESHYGTALSLFVVAGLSDGLDGLAARVLKQHTQIGQYLDPVTDKLMLSTLFLVLMHQGLVPRRVTVLVFSRDVGILLISMLLFATNALRDFRPSFFGKLNTLAQIVTLIVVLCQKVFISIDLWALRDGLLRAIAVLAPLSAAQYAWIVIRRINTPPAETVV